MSTTIAPPVGEPRLETEIEPLTIPQELRANSLVDLVHRTVLRNPDKEALRWKLPRSRRQVDGAPPEEEGEAVWHSTTYRETWTWITQVAMGLRHLGITDGDAVCIMSRTRPGGQPAATASRAGAGQPRPFLCFTKGRPLDIVGDLHHWRPLELSDLLDVEKQSLLSIPNQLHGLVHVFQQLDTVSAFDPPHHGLNDGKRHLAWGLQRLVVMDALLQINLRDRAQPKSLEDIDQQTHLDAIA